MELDFATFEQAKALQELGFPFERVPYSEKYAVKSYQFEASYSPVLDRIVKAPYLELDVIWLRNNKDFWIYAAEVELKKKYKNHIKYVFEIFYDKQDNDYYNGVEYDSYEEALSAGVDKAIEILKERNNDWTI